MSMIKVINNTPFGTATYHVINSVHTQKVIIGSSSINPSTTIVVHSYANKQHRDTVGAKPYLEFSYILSGDNNLQMSNNAWKDAYAYLRTKEPLWNAGDVTDDIPASSS